MPKSVAEFRKSLRKIVQAEPSGSGSVFQTGGITTLQEALMLEFQGATISTKRRTTIFGISWLPTEISSGDEASVLFHRHDANQDGVLDEIRKLLRDPELHHRTSTRKRRPPSPTHRLDQRRAVLQSPVIRDCFPRSSMRPRSYCNPRPGRQLSQPRPRQC